MVTISPNIARILVALVLAGCGAESSTVAAPATTSGPGSGGTGTGVIASTAATIALTATPATITTNTTSSIQAVATDSSGANVPDGTTVSFSVSNSAYGTVTASALTNSGIATAQFTAASVPGTVTITATSGAATQTTTVIITAPDNASIQYVLASPQAIGIRGSGQVETSTVVFAVKDVNGSPALAGVAVNFVMSGPSGGRLPANGGGIHWRQRYNPDHRIGLH